ncbi:MAG: hemolysin family protein [Pseudanabaenaceae cyanobacterium]
MDVVIEISLLLLLIGVNAFFAAAEIALVSSSEYKIKALVENGNRHARLLQKVIADSTKFLATIQVGVTLASFFASANAVTKLGDPLAQFLTPYVGPNWSANLSFFTVTVTIALFNLILGELVPKKIALHHAEEFALFAVYPIVWLSKLSFPIVKFLSITTNFLVSLTGVSPEDNEPNDTSIDEIKAMVDAARTGGTVGEQERRIIHGAVELRHIPARALMVPRVQIQAVRVDITLEQAYQIVSENAHTRLPVYEDDLDKIVGILHVKDLIRPLPELMQNPPTIRELMRPVRYVSENHPATDLLRDMQKNRLHMMIVQDEFGGTAGLVTLEDVLEEIVGEIRDEYDAEEEKEFRRISEHCGIFKIRASIATVNNELNVQLPRDEVATLAGLFLEELQRPPLAGDRLEIDNVVLEVLEDGQRVMVALLERPPTSEESA